MINLPKYKIVLQLFVTGQNTTSKEPASPNPVTRINLHTKKNEK